MTPRLLVTGACGLLGAHVVAAARQTYDVVGIDRNPWWGEHPVRLYAGDLRDQEFCRAVWADVAPDLVVHCAAMVNVDACEQDPGAAYAMNGDVTGVLARLTGTRGRFVYVATDSLFVGDRAMMTEQDVPCPRTVYARSKLHGEWNALLSGTPTLVARTNLYGWSAGVKRTFGEWLYGALATAAPVTLFDDAFFTPTYVVHLADMILRLADAHVHGVVNVVGSERISKYAFGLRLAELAGLPTSGVTRGSMADAGLAASRPRDMSLSSALVARYLGATPADVSTGLHDFIRDRGESPEARVALFRSSH